ncbi:MAG TPA: hypothetical protein VMD05_03230 [Candidatus Nanoarchaeia archaeon]|nr:hypothetical protein [Candidatus Nanoarchaeia archaeon]
MQVQHSCFNEFPEQCIGCPEYSEIRQDQAAQLMWMADVFAMYPPPYFGKIVKECKRFGKRRIEYLK